MPIGDNMPIRPRNTMPAGSRVGNTEPVGEAQPINACQIDIRVRYAEVDAMGYLHHARYLVYFEIGRTELLRINGIHYADMERRGLFYVVARAECRFRAPAHYDDLLTLTTQTERLSYVRVDHCYELCHGDTILAQAHTTLALVNQQGTPTRLPDDLYRLLTCGS